MINREVRDLILGILITAIVILLFSFSGQIENGKHTAKDYKKIKTEIDKRKWIIQCCDALFLNKSQFNAKVDKIFYERHKNLKRSLTLNSEDTQYRLEWDIIAENLLRQNNNFDSNENCINEESID